MVKVDYIKHSKIKRLSWIVLDEPKVITRVLIGRVRNVRVRKGTKDWSDVAISQGMLAVSRYWKRQGTDFALEPPKGTSL